MVHLVGQVRGRVMDQAVVHQADLEVVQTVTQTVMGADQVQVEQEVLAVDQEDLVVKEATET